CQKYSSPPWTF
nr:immunoglobulin light chain junction region [Macaca mulatta]MOV81522.1 immunoglobulin light chain junction region [Macaca mulatta]MOW61793.1 immunoglobulin light chain junction region [Macaca mulatta]MOW61834.1 immunoglobulin light chain junction region [Macaca mulatta]MOW62274.1 immunoglobulin light chain junction region [Macaca mulatta]